MSSQIEIFDRNIQNIYELCDEIEKQVLSLDSIPVSDSKELLLHSDAIDAIESLEVYKDGLDSEQNTKKVIYNLISLNQYLLKELSKIKLYLKNL